jgi:segregation and condensation protein B
MEELQKKVEAVLFAVGRTIAEQEIAQLVQSHISEVHKALQELKKDYESRGSPLLIIQEGSGWKLTVHERYLPVVQQINPHTELSRAILETLAVIAWKQPTKQSDVIKIRSNKAYEHIAELEKLGFIAKEKHGRSYLIKVTGKFFDYFDLPGEKGVREIFKDVKDVEEAQTKLIDQEAEKQLGLEVYEEKVKKEHPEHAERLGELEVFEEVEGEELKEEKGEFGEESEENPVEDFLKETKKKAPQEEEAEEEKEEVPEEAEEERELSPELEEMAKGKK